MPEISGLEKVICFAHDERFKDLGFKFEYDKDSGKINFTLPTYSPPNISNGVINELEKQGIISDKKALKLKQDGLNNNYSYTINEDKREGFLKLFENSKKLSVHVNESETKLYNGFISSLSENGFCVLDKASLIFLANKMVDCDVTNGQNRVVRNDLVGLGLNTHIDNSCKKSGFTLE